MRKWWPLANAAESLMARLKKWVTSLLGAAMVATKKDRKKGFVFVIH